MLQQLNEYLNSRYPNTGNVVHIRPKILLEFLEVSFQKPIQFNLNIPSSGIGSLTMLEAMLINGLLKISNPSVIFEFGTFLGYTTHILSANSKIDAKIFSLDLGSEIDTLQLFDSIVFSNDSVNDDYLRTVQSDRGAFYLSDLEESIFSKIKLIHCDSRKFDFKNHGLINNVDFFFVDGGHSYEIIKNDTELARNMSSKNSIFIWHDYNSKIHGDVTKYLDEIATDNKIYWVENSMIAFQIVLN